jgi:putative hydrolase of the HAD superfamily
MQHITAIGFDLFETLIMVENLRREEAAGRLMQSLKRSGFSLADERFFPIYRAAARRFMEAAQHSGQETHNRFWVSTALQELGYDVHPDDTRIALAVDTYFTAFTDYAVPVPGTLAMLAALKGKYRLGLLSNLTHAPAALHIIDKLGMAPFFDAVVVSGQLGYRKPHPQVFLALLDQLGTSREQTVFVGDNLEADIHGAQRMGIQPVWMTYVQSRKAREDRGPADAPPPAAASVPTITNWQDLLTLLAVP